MTILQHAVYHVSGCSLRLLLITFLLQGVQETSSCDATSTGSRTCSGQCIDDDGSIATHGSALKDGERTAGSDWTHDGLYCRSEGTCSPGPRNDEQRWRHNSPAAGPRGVNPTRLSIAGVTAIATGAAARQASSCAASLGCYRIHILSFSAKPSRSSSLNSDASSFTSSAEALLNQNLPRMSFSF
jgi:hypothetical protein